jgi:L-threonylcarbamoyladenylate synthase
VPVRVPLDLSLVSRHHFEDDQVRAAFARGEVIAYPTETFYGLGVDPHNVQAVVRVFAVKGRPPGEPLPLIASDIGQIERCCGALSPLAARLGQRFWPGPLTLVLPIAFGRFPHELTGGRSSVAVRIPDHLGAIAVATSIGGLITSTSANRSAQPPADTADAVIDALGDDVAVVVDSGPTPGGAPSTIVDVTTVTPRLVRVGAVSWERVLESLQQ